MNTYSPLAMPALLLAGVPPLTAVAAAGLTPATAPARLDRREPNPQVHQWNR